jgi:hypothetical protein
LEDPPFEELRYGEEVTDIESIRKILADFGYWLEANPPEKASGDKVVTDTILQYFGRVMVQFKEKFPEIFEGHKPQDDEWWGYPDIRSSLKKRLQRREIDAGGDTGNAETRALYIANEFPITREKARDDLSGWTRRLLESDEPQAFQKRCEACFVYHADGRGGETRYLNYNDWLWDPKLQLLETLWRESKTMEQHIMTFTSNFERLGYLCDILHAFGSYALVEDGLFRSLSSEQRVANLKKY